MTGWISLAISIATSLVTIGIAWGILKTKLSQLEKDLHELTDKINSYHIEVLNNRVSFLENAIRNIENRFDKIDDRFEKFLISQNDMTKLLAVIGQSVEQLERRRGV